MKTLFWNIGKKLTERKLDLISEAITSESPDIFCIAEGSQSKDDCQKIISVFENHLYTCYYSPLFYLDNCLSLNYKYKSNGLKVFTKTDKTASESFSFSLQRQDGRIVSLKSYINYIPTNFVFLHNLSKSGNPEVTLDQAEFIRSLADMLIMNNTFANPERIIQERTLIIGDFNLEPWDNVLKHKKYLSTNFFQVHDSIVQRNNTSIKSYFNPLVQVILEAKIENLGGTYFSDNSGWALFDYVLYDTKESNITYEVLTEFQGGTKLLNKDTKICKSFLHEGLDHLPITTKFKI